MFLKGFQSISKEKYFSANVFKKVNNLNDSNPEYLSNFEIDCLIFSGTSDQDYFTSYLFQDR